MSMTITRFTQEVNRIKTKFQSGSKPSGKDFRELIELFHAFYVDLVGGYTEILKQQTLAQIEEVVGEYVDTKIAQEVAEAVAILTQAISDLGDIVDNNYAVVDNTTQIGTVLDLTVSSANTFDITAGTTFTFSLPDADKSTTMLLKVVNGTGSIQSISFTGISAANWLDGEALTEIPAGETHVISVTSYGNTAGNLVLTHRKLG